jgi:hypothetical protein
VNAGWAEANRRCLYIAIAALRVRLAGTGTPVPEPADLDPPARYRTLRDAFGLSEFELSVLLLAAGVELDTELAEVVHAATGGELPTVDLALRTLPDAHWSALAPAAALRRWQLIELRRADRLVATGYRISERVLHFLLGIDYLPPGLAGLVEPVEVPPALPESFQAPVRRAAAAWRAEGRLCLDAPGDGGDGALRIAAAATCATLGLGLHRMPASQAPADPDRRESIARLWEREALLSRSALLVTDDTGGDPALLAAARAVVRDLSGPVVVPPGLAGEPGRAALVRARIGPPSPADRRALWQYALGPLAAALNGRLDALIAQFPVDIDRYPDLAAQALDPATTGGTTLGDRLWDACRVTARTPMGHLAERIESGAGWDRLVLPAEQLSVLHEIAAHVRHRALVHDAWGFADRLGRSLGVSALFTGPSGTGKTLAAEVLANELRLDLFRIDLSQLVSKYLGETEKNLAAVFEAAERGGAVLLFDEADALFGKRTAVKDSHDRYANIEVSYLLQRMESYRSLAILTTNQRAAMDQAFLRRLRFLVSFPFPDDAHRAAIWAGIFPAGTPTNGLDVAQLARLSVTGGNIRNIALSAAFLAAAEDRPVEMAHLLHAARSECAKLDKPLTAAEVGRWT